MLSTKKQIKERERQECLEQLRELFPPGSTVFCIIRSVARSGMSREISFMAAPLPGVVTNIDWMVCRALDLHLGKAGVKVSGCGMDMGFHIVYNLSRVMYRDGFMCTGQRHGERGCASNDHSNGDREYVVGKIHSDPGYALKHRWL